MIKIGLIILWLTGVNISGDVYTEGQALMIIAVAVGGPTLFGIGLWGLGWLIHGRFWVPR